MGKVWGTVERRVTVACTTEPGECGVSGRQMKEGDSQKVLINGRTKPSGIL